MNNKVYFTPGPSELYPTVPQHMQEAMQQKIGSISHRSKQFQEIYARAVAGMKQLLQLPDNYEVLFLASATEVWERAIQNNVREESFHLVNGSFSKRFYETAQELGRHAQQHEAPFGQGFHVESIRVPKTAELVALIQNETSSGACMPVEEINQFREKSLGEALIYVDAVSSLPYPAFDFSKVDSVYASVQKCFGLPAGLGVWLVNDRCIAKAEAILASGASIGSYHRLPALLEKARENQTVETPNVLAIYLLGKVLEDMNSKGIQTIRQETEAKASGIYTFLEQSAIFAPAVANLQHRSKTTIVANTTMPASEVNKHLAASDMQVGSGYGKYKESQIRIANFPAHSVEQVEKLVEKLRELDR
ncbi:aminotransferase class V-fold PLP-dependent enzyme [Pontibacter akesuensis]|uniref:phosphoserine transaminase n=1 Tax=Pontibacter akesuensis TaxID=388950 RepID=A0A1I7K252_9BACT|nr:aminotransferase class V-fold PLP-dependent enzyme [Pontibacter akesuensis]GHA75723.1 phosphoserine aminotransferase [Pontibacter akesuensis]SFU91425.1 phosphoserine aminotransferase apoenzyme [Pontibacter akesuensis]